MIKTHQPGDRDFFRRAPAVCARELIGTEFWWDGCAGIVVETEAYSEIGDEACHTFFRPSARRFVEAHAPGAAYVYFNYGMYWLTNVLTHDPATGERGFVLLRALQPLAGIDDMRKRRGDGRRDLDLCSGPGKLSMALGIDGEHHGWDFTADRRRGFREGCQLAVETDLRIGISRSQDLRWRFLASGSPWVSRKKSGQ